MRHADVRPGVRIRNTQFVGEEEPGVLPRVVAELRKALVEGPGVPPPVSRMVAGLTSLLRHGQLFQAGPQELVAPRPQPSLEPALHRLHGLPSLRTLPESLRRQPNDLGPRILGVRRSPQAPHGLEVVDQLHHGLLGDACPASQLREPGPRSIHQKQRPGLAGRELEGASVLEGRPEFGLQHPKGLQEEPRDRLLGHSVDHRTPAEFVKQLDEYAR
jgi:hypothetical protein